MAITKISSALIGANTIATANIADNAVDGTKIAQNSILTKHIDDAQVTTGHIIDANVTTAKIADDAVTLAKLAGLARGKIIYGDASGNPAALALGSNGTVLKSDGTDIAWATDATVAALTSEEVQDIAGAMFSSNTETGITATYQDADGTIDLVVGTLNQNTTGSAATLTTARTIGGVSFNGSANIDLPGVNSAGNQNTSGTAATVTTAAQPNITSLGTLTTLTVDDITINGSTISDGGDLTLDAAGDIILDADGTDIILKDGGTTWGLLANNSSDFVIRSAISNQDLLLQGNDGGSTITALTLDMSEGGAATFAAKVTVNQNAVGALTTDNDGSFSMAASNNFKCTPSGNFTLTFTNIVSQSGNILLINSGGHTVSAHSNTKVDATILGTISTAGTYLLAYFSDGTNVYMTNSAVYS